MPEIRCRLVAEECGSGEARDELFAGMPPLVFAKMMLRKVAMNREAMGIAALDVKRAFLQMEVCAGASTSLCRSRTRRPRTMCT